MSSSARGEPVRDHAATPRSSCALLEREGLDGLERLNGQFAFAWWQPRAAPADAGSRPLRRPAAALLACSSDGTLVFGSEAKALFASGEVRAAADLAGLDEVFTLWGAARAAHRLRGRPAAASRAGCSSGSAGEIVEQRRWWTPGPGSAATRGDGDLEDAAARQRPAAAARRRAGRRLPLRRARLEPDHRPRPGREASGELRTFSVAFDDPRYDERAHQERGRAGRSAPATTSSRSAPTEIAAALSGGRPPCRDAARPDRAGAAATCSPREVRAARSDGRRDRRGGRRAVLGLRPVQGGRRSAELHGREPERALELLDELYPYLGVDRRAPRPRLGAVPARDRGGRTTRSPPTSPASRRPAPSGRFYQAEVAAELDADAALEPAAGRSCRPAFGDWSSLERAAWLEVTTLLEPYLLAAQGDRVAMAHGVEGRYPFLDHRVFARSVAAAGRGASSPG